MHISTVNNNLNAVTLLFCQSVDRFHTTLASHISFNYNSQQYFLLNYYLHGLILVVFVFFAACFELSPAVILKCLKSFAKKKRLESKCASKRDQSVRANAVIKLMFMLYIEQSKCLWQNHKISQMVANLWIYNAILLMLNRIQK